MVAKLSLLLLAFLALLATAQVDQDAGASVAAAQTAVLAGAPAVVTSVEVTEIPITVTADTLTPEEEAAAAAASATAVVSRAIDDTSSGTTVSPPTTTPETPEQPATPRRRRNRRAGAGAGTGEVHAQAGLLNPPQPSPVTLITCKLDSAGNVADIIMWRADSATACISGCGGAVARDWSAALPGGRNVGLDFQDTQILQMSQGKLANGTVAYYSFRTDFDVRSCGNVRPNDASVTVTTQGWYANYDAVYTDLAHPTTQLARKFLNSARATCSGGKLSGLTATFNGVLVTYEKYNGRYGRTIGYGLPASCTPFFAGARDFPVDMKACEDWILSQPVATFPTNTCPTTGNSQQWVVPIPPLEMVTARPANWAYRAVSTAQVNSPKTVQNIVTTAGGPTTTTFYTISIVHAPIRNVTSFMLNWWFNGGFEGTTTLNGVRYPRYLLAHPRDHVTLETAVRGIVAVGSIVGSYINNIEFYGAAAGYTLGTDRDFWHDRNYVANYFWRVSALTATSVEYELTDLPRTVKHTWTETTVSGVPQVTVTTVMELGKAVANGATATEASNQAKMNAATLKMFGGNCVDAAINNWVRHTVEEVGNFQFFLPSLAPKPPTGK